MRTALDAKKDPARRCLKVGMWPEADRLAWRAGTQEHDVLEAGGAGAHWAPLTQNTVAESYGRWLTWLTRNGLLEPCSEPGDRVTPQNIARYVTDLRLVNASSTIVGRINGLYQALRVIAPERNWGWLRRVESRIRRTATPIRNKRARLVPSEQLMSFGLELMGDPEAPLSLKALQRATRYRDGLLIALLAARPFRLRNFASIEIGRHLIRQSQGYRLRFEPAEPKNRHPIDVPIPDELAANLACYLTHHRPILVARNRPRRRVLQPPAMALWVSILGSAMSKREIYNRIIKLTRAKFGHAINPHLFRDCAATSIAIEDPGHVYITRSILGHSTLATSEKYYNHAQSLEATRRHQTGILALRRQGRDCPVNATSVEG